MWLDELKLMGAPGRPGTARCGRGHDRELVKDTKLWPWHGYCPFRSISCNAWGAVAQKGWELGISGCEGRERQDRLQLSGTVCVSPRQTTKPFRKE